MTCCPSRTGKAPAAALPQGCGPAAPRVQIPGGRVQIGTNRPILVPDGEGPARQLRLKPFAIEPVTVSNARFAEFVAATGWVTCAERIGWSFVFHGQLERPQDHAPIPGLPWWRQVFGASWHQPFGPGSKALPDHPVTQVSHRDATAFAKWAGGRLPSEAEWEHAAQGGQNGARYPWGDAEPDDTTHTPCNIWQGHFPDLNTGADGWKWTAPVRSFAPNGYGLFNMCGNVWEWTRDPWRVRSLKRMARPPDDGPRMVIKGGSYLCHRSYCWRYRIAARSSNTVDSTTSHMGFRVAYA